MSELVPGTAAWDRKLVDLGGSALLGRHRVDKRGSAPYGCAAAAFHRGPLPRGSTAQRPRIASLILGIIGAISGLIPLLFWIAGIANTAKIDACQQ